MKVSVEFAYPMVCVPRRSRSARTVWVKDSVDVDIAEVSASDSPLGMAVRDIVLAGRKLLDIERHAIADRPHSKVLGIGEDRRIGLGDVHDHLFRKASPWSRNPPLLNERPLGLERLVSDGRDEVANLVAEKARLAYLREGRDLMVERGLPGPGLWAVNDIAVVSHVFRTEHGIETGYAFSPWRPEDVAEVEAVATDGGYTVQHANFGVKGMASYKVEGDEGRFAQDLRAINVEEASRQVRLRAGKFLRGLDAGAIRRLADLAAASERVASDVAQVGYAKALLGEFTGMVKGPGSRNAVRDVALGLAAIETAERSFAVGGPTPP